MRRPRISRPPPHQAANGDPTVGRVTPANFRRPIRFPLPNEYTSAGLARQPQRRASFAFDTIRWPHLTTLNPLSAHGSPALPFKCRHNDPSAHDDSLEASDFRRSDGAPNRPSRRPRNRGPRNRGRSRARPTDNGSRDDPPSTTESSPATLPPVFDCGEICDGTWIQSKRDRRPILFSLGKYKSAGLARRTERRAFLAFHAGPVPFVSEIEESGRGLFHGDHSEQTLRALSDSPSASRTGKTLPARRGPNTGKWLMDVRDPRSRTAASGRGPRRTRHPTIIHGADLPIREPPRLTAV